MCKFSAFSIQSGPEGLAFNSGGLRRNKIFHPLTNLVTNATENREPFFIASHTRRRRVLKALMNAPGLSREDRACFFRVVADRNHSIEVPPRELIYRFRPVAGNIDADLPHYLNRLRANAARLHAG